MEKKILGKDIPLLFACSGGSKSAELTEIVARKLAKDGSIYMSCPPVVSARESGFLEKLKKDEKVIVLDGCEVDCVAKTLNNSGFSGFLHLRLKDIGLTKSNLNIDSATVDKVYDYVKGKINDKKIWEQHKFSYNLKKDRFK
jgi:uncharacterized metal-binding protein